MSLMFQIFWIFIMIVALVPVIQRRMLETARLKLIKRFERKRESRAIALIHRQESMNLLGFPIVRYIDIEDSEEVIRAINLTDDDVPIDLILHTPGGLVLATERIACALKRHKGKVTVFIPHYAMSGGTLIALSADEIVMDPSAVIGSVDPQVGGYPAASILKVIESKDKNEIDDETFILADISRKAMNQLRECVRDILKDNMNYAKADEVADLLTRGEWTHDYPITAEEAKTIGLPISTDMPEEVYQ
ncbi:MAG: S49 family peptidase, partial [Candidatus Poribacteria bacterium]